MNFKISPLNWPSPSWSLPHYHINKNIHSDFKQTIFVQHWANVKIELLRLQRGLNLVVCCRSAQINKLPGERNGLIYLQLCLRAHFGCAWITIFKMFSFLCFQ